VLTERGNSHVCLEVLNGMNIPSNGKFQQGNQGDGKKVPDIDEVGILPASRRRRLEKVRSLPREGDPNRNFPRQRAEGKKVTP